MGFGSMQEHPALEEAVNLASLLWRRQAGALQLIVLRDQGIDELVRFKQAMLGSHQQEHFLRGVARLGIADLHPAIVAAKYHYLSNLIGGSAVEYIEESPKKVWIRYVGEDLWNQGSALVAVPAAAQRATFTAWHGHNGSLMASGRLSYVCTKVRQDGEPYNEGYFIEHDRELAPHESVRFEAVSASPPFDPGRAPRLDPVLWPRDRVLRARRRYAGAYLRSHVRTLWRLHGLMTASHLVRQAMSLLAVQNHAELCGRLDPGLAGLEKLVALFTLILESTGQPFDLARDEPARATMLTASPAPFDERLPDELADALFAFPAMLARMTSGTMAMRRDAADGSERWVVQDTGIWQH